VFAAALAYALGLVGRCRWGGPFLVVDDEEEERRRHPNILVSLDTKRERGGGNIFCRLWLWDNFGKYILAF